MGVLTSTKNHLDFIEPGKPVHNAYSESFNGSSETSASMSIGSWISGMLERRSLATRLQHSQASQLVGESNARGIPIPLPGQQSRTPAKTLTSTGPLNGGGQVFLADNLV